MKRLNDSSPAQQIVGPSAAVQFVTDWYDGAGGSFIVFQDVAPGTGLDLLQVARSGDPKPVPLVRTVGDDTDGRVSPNGRWLAYVSTETGRSEVYVRALSGGNNRWPISTDGGVSPRWRGDGSELFYIATASTLPFGATVPDGRLMAVQVSGAVERFTAGIPKLLFPVSAKGSQYHPSSRRPAFLDQHRQRHVRVAHHGDGELAQRTYAIDRAVSAAASDSHSAVNLWHAVDTKHSCRCI